MDSIFSSFRWMCLIGSWARESKSTRHSIPPSTTPQISKEKKKKVRLAFLIVTASSHRSMITSILSVSIVRRSSCPPRNGSKKKSKKRQTFGRSVNVEEETIFALIGQHQLHPLELVVTSPGHRLQTGAPAIFHVRELDVIF